MTGTEVEALIIAIEAELVTLRGAHERDSGLGKCGSLLCPALYLAAFREGKPAAEYFSVDSRTIWQAEEDLAGWMYFRSPEDLFEAARKRPDDIDEQMRRSLGLPPLDTASVLG